jgi:hypothetical protein
MFNTFGPWNPQHGRNDTNPFAPPRDAFGGFNQWGNSFGGGFCQNGGAVFGSSPGFGNNKEFEQEGDSFGGQPRRRFGRSRSEEETKNVCANVISNHG